MNVLASFRASVESSTTISSAAYAVDPKGTTDVAIKAASNGPSVIQATSSVSLAAARAATNAAAFANGTILTGTPKSTLAARLAGVATGLNASRLALSAFSVAGAVTVETTVEPVQNVAGVAAAPAVTASAIDFDYSLASAVAFAVATLGSVLAWLRWRRQHLQRAQLLAKPPPPTAIDGEKYMHHTNPLHKGKRGEL